MLVGMIERGIKFDAVLFADTGGEKPHTYKHIAAVNEWLEALGRPTIITVEKVNRAGERYPLERECLDKKTLPSLAFGFKTCSQKHKAAPQDKWMNNCAGAREVWGMGNKVDKYIGYDAGEERRVKVLEDDKYILHYPLIEWDWDREECEEAIKRAGLPLPGKSSCFFCPAMKKNEILWLKNNHPDLLQRALTIEENAMEGLGTVKGLGRNFSWKAFIKADAQQGSLFPESYIEQACGCYDG